MRDDEKFKILIKVLTTETVSHPPHDGSAGDFGYQAQYENGEWQGDLVSERFLHSEEMMFPNITCFADIPYEALGIHMEKYSKFGLSFSKEFVAKRGGRPVMYFPIWGHDPHNQLFGQEALRQIGGTVRGMTSKDRDDKLSEHEAKMIFMDFLAYIKPFDVTLKKDHFDQVYMEREWRKIGNLKFNSLDIKCIILPEKYHSTFSTILPELKDLVVPPPAT